jgi:hypothetical protein
MNRRDFVAASIGASFGAARPAASEQATPEGKPPAARPQLLELRRYQFRSGPMEARHAEYAKTTLVPALNRAGVRPVGAFGVNIGPDRPAVYMLLAHPDMESVVTLAERVSADAEYKKAAAAFRSLPASDPPYLRRASSLMLAFEGMPALQPPSGPNAGASRVFELRTYESHNENANLKKVEMFDKAGEIAIFRRLGITPVFFGRDVVGPLLPSLTYLVVFPDMAAREKAWADFGSDPEWVKLRTLPAYLDIVSNTHIQLLRPTSYSQI